MSFNTVPEIGPSEKAGYFEVPGAHLYTVLHGAEQPIARILLVGPFASERHYSYIPWVRWARYLAARGIECLRYDYRGIGESTGVFEEMTFEHWIEDAYLLSRWLKSRLPDLPLVLHGLDLGALLAWKAFESGLGDVLLLWSPPASANQVLRSALTRRVSMDHAFRYSDERKPLSDYLAQIEDGRFLEVEGYRWSGRLWADSFGLELPALLQSAGSEASVSRKPVRVLKLGKQSVPLIKGSSVGYEAISRDFTGLFQDNFEWISSNLLVNAGGERH